MKYKRSLIDLDRAIAPLEAGLLALFLRGCKNSLLESSQVQRVYLDELGEAASQSLGVGLVQLVVESEKRAANQARRLIEKARQETVVGISSQEIIELIETMTVYKFPHLSRQEVE